MSNHRGWIPFGRLGRSKAIVTTLIAALSLVTVPFVSIGASVDLADGFEDGDTDEYSLQIEYGQNPGFQAATDRVFEGEFSGKFSDPARRTEARAFSMPGDGLGAYPLAGDSITVKALRDATAGRSRVLFGVQDTQNFYMVTMEDRDRPGDEVHLTRVEGGQTTDLASGGHGIPDNSWEEVRIGWGLDGRITVEFSFTSATLTARDTTFTDGGIGLAHQIGNRDSGEAWFDAIEVGPLVPPPVALNADPGGRTGEVRLDWQRPADLDAGEVDHYTVYRGEDGEDPIRLGATTDTRFTDATAGCFAEWTYEVTVTTVDGAESRAATETVEPTTPTHLLCRLNQQHDFYWGPVEADNTDGPPDPPPTSLAAIDAHTPSSELPQWFLLDPATVACCERVVFDTNRLVAGNPGEIDFSPAEQIETHLPGGPVSGAAAGLVEEFAEKGKGEATFDGFLFEGTPFEDPDLAGQAAIDSTTGVGIAGQLGCTGLAGSTTLEGKLFIDEATYETRFSDPDALFVQAGGTLCEFTWSGGVDWTADLPLVGLVGMEGSLEAEVLPSVSGMLGGQVATGTLSPQLLAGGAGGKALVDGQLEAEVEVPGVEVEGVGAGDGTASLKGEVFHPIGDGPREIVVSPYTDVVYRGIEGTVFTLLVGPVSVETLPVYGEVELFDHAVKDFEANPPDVEWDGVALVFGDAEADSQLGTTIQALGGGFSLAANGSTTSPATLADEDLLVDVEGQPGEVADVTIRRPVAARAANGSFVVDDWSVTLPSVEVGPQGTASLHVDTGEVQAAVQALSADPSVSVDEAIDRVNRELDTNGDGAADLDAGATSFDPRAPTALRATVEGPGGERRQAFVGEPVTARVTLADLVNATPATGPGLGDVELSADGVALARAPLTENGTATVETFLPADTPEGPLELTLSYAGSDRLRAASTTHVLDVADRAPQPDLLEPEAFAVLNKTSARWGNATVDVDAIDVASVQARTGDGAWIPVGQATETTYRVPVAALVAQATAEEGVHAIQVRATDAAGQRGWANRSVVVDTGPAIVHAEPGAPVLEAGDALNVSFEADEPVAVRLNVTRHDENGSMLVLGDGFAENGSIQAGPFEEGVYTYTVEAIDTARSPPRNANATRTFPLVVLERPQAPPAAP